MIKEITIQEGATHFYLESDEQIYHHLWFKYDSKNSLMYYDEKYEGWHYVFKQEEVEKMISPISELS